MRWKTNLECDIPLSDNEMSTYNEEDMHQMVSWLLRNHYAVMVTKEDFGLFVINYEWCENMADRNQMVFMDRCTFEENYQRVYNEEEENGD